MERSNLSQLVKILKSISEISGAKYTIFSLLNDNTGQYEIKIIEGLSAARLEEVKNFAHRQNIDFNPYNVSCGPTTNEYIQNIIENKSYQTADLKDVLKSLLSEKTYGLAMTFVENAVLTTYPIVIDQNVQGLISYLFLNNINPENKKLLDNMTEQVTLFLESILLNEKLIAEVRKKTISLEQEKNNLEQNVRERTQKLDNSRSALLFMLKDIDKASKELSSSKEYTDNIIRSMIESLIVVNNDAIIHKVNKATLDLLGYKENELLEQHLSIIFPSTDSTSADIFISKLIDHGYTSSIERAYLKKNGNEIPVIISGSLMKRADNDFQGIVLVASDITARKKHEKEIQKQNERIRSANKELRLALAKAEESERLKTAFLANMSHEIRTPLNGIMGFAELLQAPYQTPTDLNYYGSIICTCGNQLLRIVNDILDISKIEAGLMQITLNAFSVNQVINELFALYNQKNEQSEKNIQLIIHKELPDKDCQVLIDEIRLRQILSNLIDNALKFTLEGHVKFGYTIKMNMLEFFVEDSGIGIPKDRQAQIFKPFVQADQTTTRRFGGTGLGLAIAHGLITIFNGKIWLKSVPDKGTTFYFTIPFVPVVTEKPSEEENLSATDYKWNNKLVLVVEDEHFNAELIRSILKPTGINMLFAVTGTQAVEKCMGNPDIDLVLMDVRLPEIDGLQATAEIRKHNTEIPIIAQTAHASHEDRAKCIDAGCNNYITKPINAKELFILMNQYLS